MPTYKHNDYYGYINKIQEKGIANPEWFWSESPDASEARQWLYNNGASAIVDDIYKNTPEEMKMKIPAKMLSNDIRETRVTDYQREKTNDAADTTFKVGLGIAGAPALINSLALTPIASISGLLGGIGGGLIGGRIGTAIGNNIYTKGTENNGIGSIISTNRNAGSEIGTVVGGLWLGSKLGNFGRNSIKYAINKYKLPKWLHQPEQTFQSTLNEMKNWSDALDMYPKWKEMYPKYEPEPLARYSSNSPITIIDEPTISQIPNTIKTVQAAERVIPFYKKYGNWIKSFHINIDPDLSIGGSYASPDRIKYMFSTVFDPKYVPQNEILTIGAKGDPYPHFTREGVIAHEFGHTNSLFNTRNTGTLSEWPKYGYSPKYGNDYSGIALNLRKIFKSPWLPSEIPTIDKRPFVNIHDYELSEGFSDAFANRQQMQSLGIGNGQKLTLMDLLKYRYTTPEGFNNRFFRQRPGWFRQLKALNNPEFKIGETEN